VNKNSRLPNFQNLGIMLCILLLVNLFGMFAAILLSNPLSDFIPTLTTLSTVLQPILLLSILLLYPLFKRLPDWQSVALIMTIGILLSALVYSLFKQYFSFDTVVSTYRTAILAMLATAALLYYFDLRQRAYSPAITEARLQALPAGIRPHFLFNSINAVLSLIRSQPKRAKTALEDMSDLFRVLMAENRVLVTFNPRGCAL
jgi:two-component system sensor histidine kinase AlgZ